MAELWTTAAVALLYGDVGLTEGGGCRCQGLNLSKRNQLASSVGAERRISSAFMAQDCFHLHSPRRRAIHRPQPACQSQAHAWTHTHIHVHAKRAHTFSLSFMPDYNRIILNLSKHSKIYGITWERWMVQKITIITAYIYCAFVPVSACTRDCVCVCVSES